MSLHDQVIAKRARDRIAAWLELRGQHVAARDVWTLALSPLLAEEPQRYRLRKTPLKPMTPTDHQNNADGRELVATLRREFSGRARRH